MNLNTDDAKNNQMWNAELISQYEQEISTIEAILHKELKTLEGSLSTDFEEEVPQTVSPSTTPVVFQITNRIRNTLKRLNLAGRRLLREQKELKEELKQEQSLSREIMMERDVLLQQVHNYLRTNSSLRERLEEQRCQTGALQRQRNSDLESQIKVLENEKEKLSDLNLEKDKKIHEMNVMLEEAAKQLKKNETEILNMKNNECHSISSLKEDSVVAVEEKTKMDGKFMNLKDDHNIYFLSKNLENLSLKGNLTLRKSQSEGNLGEQLLKINAKCKESNQITNISTPKCGQLSSNIAISLQDSKEKEKKTEFAESSVHNQLNALRHGLYNVTKKLEMLKSQLVSSGAIVEITKPGENCRNLKRKASYPDESDCSISEDPKMGFKNLRNILEDAKSLNAKLQNMREEKQRIIDLNKKEAGVQATIKKNEKLCQTSGLLEMPFLKFQYAMKKLKMSMRDCEERINGHQINAEEALNCFICALSACVVSNFKDFREWKKKICPRLLHKTDTYSLMDEISNISSKITSPEENGGGDNLLKKRISKDALDWFELEIQIDRLKYKIFSELCPQIQAKVLEQRV